MSQSSTPSPHHQPSPSQPPRHPRTHDGERVIERVIKKSSSTGIVYPTLTRMNYTEWSLVMKMNLQATGLWDIIVSGDGDYHNDRTALTAILRAVPLEMQAGL
jgi:hypothetical protein